MKETTHLKEIMTLERFDPKAGSSYYPITAAEVAALIRTGGKVTGTNMGAAASAVALCGDYTSALETLRAELAVMRGVGVGYDAISESIPKLLPMARLDYDGGGYVYSCGSGVVCLDVQNVFSDEEREAVRQGVRTLPMTLMVFVGSSGMSMKVLVRVRPARAEQVATPTAYLDFMRLAMKQMRVIYANVIPQRISQIHDLHLADGLTMSADPQVLFVPDSQAAVVNDEVSVRVPLHPKGDGVEQELRLPVPADLAHRDYYDRVFNRLMSDVHDEFVAQGREADLETAAYMQTVVERAAQLKVSEAEVCARMVRMFGLEQSRQMRDYVRGVYAKLHPLRSSGNATADNIYLLEDMLFGRYEFSKNIINSALYMRERTTFGQWRRVGVEDVNTLVVEAQEAGVKANRNLVESLLGSNRITTMNPITRLIGRVRGTWDGKDRIEALARHVPTSCKRWPQWFHIWFCAMVRQWAWPDKDYANQVVPILVGPQGVGKSTFWRRLLPPELMDGYMESGDFKAEKEMLRAMATFQLINIDEFNRYSRAEQEGIMKNFIQRPDIRLRQPYRQSFEVLPRRASFVATCNPVEVLADETGSRRYICVQVAGIIRQMDDIDYDQLYAQAVDEIEARRRQGKSNLKVVAGRCYFSKAEEAAIVRNNQRFMRSSLAVERFNQLFEPFAGKRGRQPSDVEKLTRDEIFQQVEQGLRKPLGERERKSLYQYLRDLYKQGKIARKKEGKGDLYRVKRRI